MNLILLVFAFVLLSLAATNLVPEPPRIRLVAAGLACWVLSEFVGHFHL